MCVCHVHCSIVLFCSDICVIPGCFNRVQQQPDFHMKPQPDEMARTQTARFYIYGIGAVSKSTFDDPQFRPELRRAPPRAPTSILVDLSCCAMIILRYYILFKNICRLRSYVI